MKIKFEPGQTNASGNRHKSKANAIARLLELVEGADQDLESSRSIDNTLLVKQYERLKKGYAKQLLELLDEFNLPIRLDEAA